MNGTPVTYVVVKHTVMRCVTYAVVAVFKGGLRMMIEDDMTRAEARAKVRVLNRALEKGPEMSDEMSWEVVEGFGDIDAPETCFDVEVVARFRSEADADAFTESHYEKRLPAVEADMPDWLKSFWVICRRVGEPKAKAGDPLAADATLVAEEFDRVLREWLSAGQYAEMLRLNRTPKYSGNRCASHDFCDANMAMERAMQTFSINCDKVGVDDDVTTLWNAAWAAWRKSKSNT